MRYDIDRKTALWLKLMDMGEATGCHQLPERSFFIGSWQFPVCARCTGVMIGQIIGIPLSIRCRIPPKTAVICCCGTLADWLIQRLGIKDSTNARRLITGLLGGIGTAAVYIHLIRKAVILIMRKIRPDDIK